jgi:hypothetical protein
MRRSPICLKHTIRKSHNLNLNFDIYHNVYQFPMKIDVFPLLTLIFLSLIVNPLALSVRAEVGNKMTLMNAYLINGDGNLLSKSVDKNTAGITDHQQSILTRNQVIP